VSGLTTDGLTSPHWLGTEAILQLALLQMRAIAVLWVHLEDWLTSDGAWYVVFTIL
jgi:hypothetical protein